MYVYISIYTYIYIYIYIYNNDDDNNHDTHNHIYYYCYYYNNMLSYNIQHDTHHHSSPAVASRTLRLVVINGHCVDERGRGRCSETFHIPSSNNTLLQACVTASLRNILAIGMKSISHSKQVLLYQSCTRRGIGRQGVGTFLRNSYVSTLCPVVLCPYQCTSD